MYTPYPEFKLDWIGKYVWGLKYSAQYGTVRSQIFKWAKQENGTTRYDEVGARHHEKLQKHTHDTT